MSLRHLGHGRRAVLFETVARRQTLVQPKSPKRFHSPFPVRGHRMQLDRRREPRYPFIAMAEIVDEKENVRTSSRVSDLSLHGCYIELNNPFPQGTNVSV